MENPTIYTWLNRDSAPIGRTGRFSNSLKDLANGGGTEGTLIRVLETDAAFSMDHSAFCFFVPNKEPEYRPFISEERDLFRGKWVTDRDVENNSNKEEYLITGIEDTGVSLSNGSFYDFENLLELFIFLDGSLCGELE